MTVTIQFQRLRPKEDADIELPQRMTPHSAGMDIQAAISAPIELQPGDIVLIPTGFAMALPEGYEAQIRPRSGLAIKHGITLVNTPGTIDADYRGEVKIAMIHLGKEPYTIRRKDRIAQMIISAHETPHTIEVAELSSTERFDGGFGHTGV